MTDLVQTLPSGERQTCQGALTKWVGAKVIEHRKHARRRKISEFRPETEP